MATTQYSVQTITRASDSVGSHSDRTVAADSTRHHQAHKPTELDYSGLPGELERPEGLERPGGPRKLGRSCKPAGSFGWPLVGTEGRCCMVAATGLLLGSSGELVGAAGPDGTAGFALAGHRRAFEAFASAAAAVVGIAAVAEAEILEEAVLRILVVG